MPDSGVARGGGGGGQRVPAPSDTWGGDVLLTTAWTYCICIIGKETLCTFNNESIKMEFQRLKQGVIGLFFT